MGAKQRYFLLLFIDSIIVTFSVFLGYYILAPFFLQYTWPTLAVTSVILLVSHHVFAYIFNLYHRAWEYASVRELMSITLAVSGAIITTYILIILLFQTSFTRLMIITWMMHVILIGGSRLSWRVARRYIVGKNSKESKMTRTLVVGAGKGGTILIKQILDTPSMGMNPIVAVDDESSKQRMELNGGVKVEGTREDIHKLILKYGIEKVVVAIPSLPRAELKEIHDTANHDGVEVMIMPNIDAIMSGRVKVYELKKVENFLGRARGIGYSSHRRPN